MRPTFVRFLPILVFPLLPVVAAPILSACGSSKASTTTGAGAAGSTSGTGGAGGTDGGGTGGSGGTFDPTALCPALSITALPFSQGPYGPHRGDLADDFTLHLLDGTDWTFKTEFSGCESYVFIPDSTPVSWMDSTSVWESASDLTALVKQSPQNVQYFFVSQKATDADATAAVQAMDMRIKTMLGTLKMSDQEHWRPRLHTVATRAGAIEGWMGGVWATSGKIGFAIDRLQRVRGSGDLADVDRYSSALDTMMMWPFKNNLSYAAHDPAYYNAQADEQTRLDAENATVVNLWTGDVLMQEATTMATIPPTAGFDTLEVEVTQQCPNPDEIEIGNCGAWDYIANLNIADDPTNPVEIARFITSYHRETHWVEDISDMLPLLNAGMHSFLWSFAPSWNTQPTATKLSLRFSNQGKAARPSDTTFLFAGGNFDDTYNTGRSPVAVNIPSTTTKVELFVIVTGHGSDATTHCGEFCDHQHEFTINGHVHTQDFPGAGTSSGCIANIANGMTPNQAGTWWYGRGGWCPGMQVDPWVVDVTGDVMPGETATVTYRGLLNNADPPAGGTGNIVMTSYLVVQK